MLDNNVMLVGNAGGDPEISYSPKGTENAKFSVASRRRNGETMWVNVECWDKVAEIARFNVSKGTRVFVEGPLDIRTWQDKDGSFKTWVKVVAETIYVLGRMEFSDPNKKDFTAGFVDQLDSELFEDDGEAPF